jgi:tripartite-type tricarboxylate transporter receptor subunit TctC
MKRILFLMTAVFFLPGMVLSPLAADYPAKPVTIVVPMAPGGARDLQCRAFAAFAEKALGKPFVVVNKPGASGMIGMLAGAQAAPDGYTLTGSSTSDIGAVEWEIANGRKSAVTRHDFIALGTFTVSPTLIAVPYNSPWKTVADLVREVKAKPGHYAFCSGGMYNATHLSAEVFIRATGLKVRHVPYPGGGAAVSALVGNHGDFGCPSISSSLYLARGNKLRVLAVQSDKRCRLLPDIPTVKELGIDAEFPTWQGILAPLKTPKAIVEKLQDILEKATQDKGFIKIIEGQGDEVVHLNGDEMSKYLEQESAKFAKLLKILMEEEKGKK